MNNSSLNNPTSIEQVTPDYDAIITLEKANGRTERAGLLVFVSGSNFYAVNVTIGDLPLIISGSYGDRDCLLVPTGKNTPYTCANWGVINGLYFVPYKGD